MSTVKLYACEDMHSRDRSVWIWDVAVIREPIQAYSDWTLSVVFSPDWRHIAFGSDHGLVETWDAHTGAAKYRLLQRHRSFMFCVAYSPTVQEIAPSSDGEVIIWNA